MASSGIRLRFGLWVGAILALVAWSAVFVRPHFHIETDILALLPAAERDVEAEKAVRAYSDGLARKLVFVVGGQPFAASRAAAAQFAQRLRASQAFGEVTFEAPAALQDVVSVYAPYRDGVLDESVRAQLASDPDGLMQRALQALYAPAGPPRPLPVVQDPLNLFGAFLMRGDTPGHARLREGVLTVGSDAQAYVLVGATVAASPFSMAAQDRLIPVIESARDQARAEGLEVLGSGLLLHAAAATRQGQRDISRVGSLSLLGVVLMVWLSFRSPRPLVLSALILGTGAVAATALTHAWFGSLHLVTLVFGTSLIGVGIDYSNHFLADQFREGTGWTPASALAHVGRGVATGMGCGVLGYLALALAPLPGLRQMAVFCAIGLVVSGLGVLCLYPVLARRSPRRDDPWLLRASHWLDERVGRLTPAGRATIAALFLGLVATGLWRLQFHDDVRLLQSPAPEVLAQEQRLRHLLGYAPDTRLFLVRAPTPDAVLVAQERLSASLDEQVAQGHLAGYSALSGGVPSAEAQRRDRALVAQRVWADGGLAPRLLESLGFDAGAIRAQQAAFAARGDDVLTLEAWLASPAGAALRHLWLGPVGDGYAGIVSLAGVKDVAALAALQQPGVQLVDRVAEISDVLSRYRRLSAALIAAAYAVIGGLLAVRYGIRDAARLLLVPVAAACGTLALFGLLGIPATLFSVLALFLVLGLGVDYAVFLREGRGGRGATTLALALSTLGTVLAYGLLAFSETGFIRTIGLSLLCGIALTFLLALASERPQPLTETE
ncbi:MAG TPA: MMPL family transporter [Nevskiaceae bacterium]|nr:MMPL family transporter [Nevskiaceae bacterium]